MAQHMEQDYSDFDFSKVDGRIGCGILKRFEDEECSAIPVGARESFIKDFILGMGACFENEERPDMNNAAPTPKKYGWDAANEYVNAESE